MFHNIFPKLKEKEPFLTLFYERSITLTPKPHKDSSEKYTFCDSSSKHS